MSFRDDRNAALIETERLRLENDALRAELARKPAEAPLRVPYHPWWPVLRDLGPGAALGLIALTVGVCLTLVVAWAVTR